MNTRQTLHELVDQLPDEQLTSAVRVLKGLDAVPADWTALLANVPIDDEPDDDFDGGLTEALQETDLVSHEEVKRRYLR
jgi:hypothetical protein